MKQKDTIPIDLIDFANKSTLKSPRLPLGPDIPEGVPPLFIQVVDSVLTRSHETRKLLLPNLQEHVESICVFSDYGGEHKGSKYQSYSVLVAGWNALYYFFDQMLRIRHEYGLDNPYKEIAFKSFNYGQLRAALPEILRVADFLLPGLLFTLVVDRRIPTILSDNSEATRKTVQKLLQATGFDVWKEKVTEKALRVSHLAAYLTALLARDGHKVFWMTDHDEIAAKDEMHKKLSELYYRLLDYYSNGMDFEIVGYGLPLRRDPSTGRDLSDLLSMCDLAAGALASFFSDSVDGEPEDFKSSTNEILKWLCHDGLGLKKVVMMIEIHEEAGLSGHLVELKEKEPSKDFVLVPVVF